MSWSGQGEFGKLERQVIAMEWEGKPARALVITRKYETNADDLWEAITKPERLKRWFGAVSGDFRQGGRYQIQGNAEGSINKCEAPKFLAVTWEMHGGIGWVNATLEPLEDELTELTIEHIAHDEKDFLAFWEHFGPGAMGVGWDVWLAGLVDHLASGADAFSLDEEGWLGTEEGRVFVQASSDAWVEAAITFGTNAEAARRAGEHTFEFFTNMNQ